MQYIQCLHAISLFSGAGGMDVGFRKAGFNTIFANDIDSVACETYRLNHGEMIFDGPLQPLLPLMRHMQDIDLVYGGPPCQGFSVAGKMNPDDERNTLIWTFMDVVDCVSPRAFVCENVKALGAFGRWKDVRDELLRRARIDYETTLIVLNSQDFGVPQNRERMFLIGLRKDLLRQPSDSIADFVRYSLERCKSEPANLGSIVKKLGKAGSDRNRRVCRAKITFAKQPVMRPSPYAGMLFNGAGRPLRPDGRASTLPATMGGNKTPIVDEGVIFEGAESYIEKYHAYLRNGGKPYIGEAPSRLRRLTVDECLAIQTFPEGYQLAGSQSAMYRQIGNAVPCRLAEAVATATRELIESGGVASEAPAVFHAAE